MNIVKDENIKICVSVKSTCPLCGKTSFNCFDIEVTEFKQYQIVSCNHGNGCGADYVISGALIFEHNVHAITNIKSEVE